MSAISLSLSEWAWRTKATLNFYLAPTRAWELLAGSIAAFIVHHQGVRKNSVLALVGLAAILFSIFHYDESTPFPSGHALLPVIGVILLILYAGKETVAAKLLGSKGLVAIGLFSYSAYLWHQPLFAFARIRSIEEPSLKLTSILSLTSLMLGYISRRYVETPFRDKEKLNARRVLAVSVLMIVTPIAISAYLASHNLGRSMPSGEKYAEFGYVEAQYEKIGYAGCEGLMLTTDCGHNSNSSIVAWGDSYVKDGIPFIQIYEKSSVAQAALSSCTPFVAELEEPRLDRRTSEIAECARFNEEVIDLIKADLKVERVVLGSAFSLIEAMTEEQILDVATAFQSGLQNFLTDVDRPIEVLLFPPPPTPNYDPSRCVDKHLIFGKDVENCNFRLSEVSEEYLKQKLLIDVLAERGVQVYPLEEVMCPNGICIAFRENVRIYRDHGHIRNAASRLLGEQALLLNESEPG